MVSAETASDVEIVNVVVCRWYRGIVGEGRMETNETTIDEYRCRMKAVSGLGGEVTSTFGNRRIAC